MKIDPQEINTIQEALDNVPNWNLEVFNVWESTKGQLKITIRLGRE